MSDCTPLPKPEKRKKKTRGGFKTKASRYCQYCGSTDMAIHRHHTQYRSQGGQDQDENRIDLCVKCHAEAHQHRIDKEKLQAAKDKDQERQAKIAEIVK